MQEEIFSSSFAAAAYLDSVNFPKDKKVPGHHLDGMHAAFPHLSSHHTEIS